MIKMDVDKSDKEQWMKHHRTMMMITQDFMDQKEILEHTRAYQFHHKVTFWSWYLSNSKPVSLNLAVEVWDFVPLHLYHDSLVGTNLCAASNIIMARDRCSQFRTHLDSLMNIFPSDLRHYINSSHDHSPISSSYRAHCSIKHIYVKSFPQQYRNTTCHNVDNGARKTIMPWW